MLSPAEMAIGCLLHQPALALVAGDPGDLRGSQDLDLLRELLVFLQAGPHMSEAVILEHWRESPEAWAKLNKVAQAGLTMLEEGLDKQFQGYLAQFRSSPLQARLDQLIAESRKRTLNSAENAELSQLLATLARKPAADNAKSS